MKARLARGEGIPAPQNGSIELQEKHNEQFECEICGGKYTYRNKNAHIQTIKHQKSTKVKIINQCPKYRLVHCGICDRDITKNNISTHNKSKTHLRNLSLFNEPSPVKIGSIVNASEIIDNKCLLCGMDFIDKSEYDNHLMSVKHTENELKIFGNIQLEDSSNIDKTENTTCREDERLEPLAM